MRTSDALTIGRALGRIERTIDAWEESKHPRADNGQFSSTNGGGGSSKHSESMQKPKMGMAALKEAQKGTRIVDKEGHVYVKGQHELPWKRDDGNRYSSAHLAQSVGVWPDDSNNASNGKLNNSEGQAAKSEAQMAREKFDKLFDERERLASSKNPEDREKAKAMTAELEKANQAIVSGWKEKAKSVKKGGAWADPLNKSELEKLELAREIVNNGGNLTDKQWKVATSLFERAKTNGQYPPQQSKESSKPPEMIKAKGKSNLKESLAKEGFKMDSADWQDLTEGKVNKRIILHKDGEEYMAELTKYRDGGYEVSSIHK